jgi:hypothetical protein
MVASSPSSRVLISAGCAGFLASCTILLSCGSSGNTYTSPSALTKCSVNVETPAAPLPAAGGTAIIAVKTERECQWAAQPDVGWLTIMDGSSGQGDGNVKISAAANADPVARSGAITINGQRAQVSQAAGECGFELGTRSASYPPAGGSGSVDVRASSAVCTWTAASDASWVEITSGASGKGNTAVAFTVQSTTGPPRTATLTIAGLHFSITQSEGCTYAINPASYSAGASGGTSAVTVTAGAGCPWTAASEAPWISITATSGAGNGTVGFTVAPTAGPARTGTVTIAGQVLTVTQSPGCSFDVSPATQPVDASGGTRTISVNAASGCAWNAISNVDWITVTAGSSGNGAGTVTISVAPTSGPSRSGTLTIAGQTVTVTQGQGCTYAISPDSQSVPPAGGTGTVNVSAGAGCGWTASSNAEWLSIVSGASGSGNGKVSFKAASTGGPARSGTLTIAGRTFTVNQGQGCSFTLSSTDASARATGDSGAFDVRAADGCGWSAASNADWLSVSSGAQGSGNGTVRYTVAANTGGQRVGVISVAGHTFTVTQAGGCSFSISPDSVTIPAGGESSSFAINGSGGCAWTVTATASWITITSDASGNGGATVQFAVAANSGASRTGTITAAGQTFTVVQKGACTFNVAPETIAIGSGGGSQNVTISTSGECSWSAASNVPWVGISMGANGTGNGTARLDVQANSGPARSGNATVADRTVTINQDSGCTYSLDPSALPVAAAGGPGSFSVRTAPGCTWSAVSGVPWITIPQGTGGSGDGMVQFTVEGNATGTPRTGTIAVADQTFTVTQAAADQNP